jgi:hypothetical protein
MSMGLLFKRRSKFFGEIIRISEEEYERDINEMNNNKKKEIKWDLKDMFFYIYLNNKLFFFILFYLI